MINLIESVSIDGFRCNGITNSTQHNSFYDMNSDHIMDMINVVVKKYGKYSIFPIIDAAAKKLNVDVYNGISFNSKESIVMRISSSLYDLFGDDAYRVISQLTERQCETIVFNAWLDAAMSDFHNLYYK